MTTTLTILSSEVLNVRSGGWSSIELTPALEADGSISWSGVFADNIHGREATKSELRQMLARYAEEIAEVEAELIGAKNPN